MALRDSVLNIVIRAKDLTKGVFDKFKKDTKAVDEQATKTASGGLTRLAKAAAAAVTAFFGFQTAKNALLSVLQTGDKFEKLALQLEAVTGSIAGGEQATEWIKEFTKSTPLQLEQVTEAFITLKNFGLDPQNGTLQAIVDQNEKLGGGYERLIGITRALGQAQAKQKLQGEEILQLIERGVPVWQLLADVTGKTTSELNKMSSDGALTVDVIDQLIRAMGEQAQGAAARNMTTLSGIVSNLKDQWVEFLNAIAESGTLDYVKVQLSELAAKATELARNGTLAAWAREASDAFISVLSGLKSIATTLVSASGAITLFAQAWVAAKLIDTTRALKNMAFALTDGVTPGALKARDAIKSLGVGLLAVGVVNFVQQTKKLVEGLYDIVKAEKALKAAREDGLGVDEIARQKLAEFTEQTGLAARGLEDINAAIEAGLVIRDTANNQWIAGAEAVQAYKDGVAALEAATGDLNDNLNGPFRAAVQAAIGEFQSLKIAGDATEESLQKVFKNYDLRVTSDVAELVAVLAELQQQGEITAIALERTLGDALTSLTANELRAFAINAQLAFDQGRIGAEEFAVTIDTTVSEALGRLGVDIAEIETGISSTERAAIDSFNLIRGSIGETGDSADEASKKIVAAFTGAFADIKNEAARAELLAGLREEVTKGTISAAEYYRVLALVGGTSDATAAQTENLTEKVRELKRELAETDGPNVIKETNEAASAGGGAYAAITLAISGFTQEMSRLGDAARATWVDLVTGVRGAGDAVDTLESKLAAAQDRIRYLAKEGYRAFDATGLRSRLIEMGTAAEQVKESFYEQQIALRDLQEEYSRGTVSAERYIQQAERMIENGNLLNEQDLSSLRDGIQQARREMEALNESAENTLTNLQDELDRLKGNTDAIRERQYQQRITDLEAQLEFARKTRSEDAIRDLEESLRIAREIYDTENIQRKEAEQERRRQEQARARERQQSAQQRSQVSTRSGGSGNDKTVTLDLKMGGTSVGRLTGVSESEAALIIDSLERASFLSAG